MLVLGCGEQDPPPERQSTTPPPPKTSQEAQQWAELTRVEGVILELDENLAELAFSVRNLELPDARTRGQFAPVGLHIQDLGPAPENPDFTLDGIGARVWVSPPAELESDRIPIGLQLWLPLLEARLFA